MANYRLVNTAMWDDDWFSNLDYTERYLFLYLLTNPLTNISGIYQIPLKRMAYDTGMDQPMIKKLMERFTIDKKVFYEIGYVVFKNWHRNQHLNTNQMQAAISTINGLPEWLRRRILDPLDPMFLDLESLLNTSIDLGNPLLTLLPKRSEREVKEKINPPNPPNGGKPPAVGDLKNSRGNSQKVIDPDDASWPRKEQ